jgi:uncharacterized OsmC-like protein
MTFDAERGTRTMTEHTKITLRQERDFRFAIDFGAGIPELYSDEAPPLGGGTGPTPVQLLGAAVGNCLSDSLLFALRKFHQEPRGITTEVETAVGRNTEGRLRVTQIRVAVRLGAPAAELQHLERALTQFERFCTVAQSVGQGVPVEVTVWDSTGAKLK